MRVGEGVIRLPVEKGGRRNSADEGFNRSGVEGVGVIDGAHARPSPARLAVTDCVLSCCCNSLAGLSGLGSQ